MNRPSGPSPAAQELAPLLSTFVDRTREIDAVTQSLQASRLITLTGSGGIGKTCLALQVATKIQADVVAVQVAPLADPDPFCTGGRIGARTARATRYGAAGGGHSGPAARLLADVGRQL